MIARGLLLLGVVLVLATFAAPQAPYAWWQTLCSGLLALLFGLLASAVQAFAVYRRTDRDGSGELEVRVGRDERRGHVVRPRPPADAPAPQPPRSAPPTRATMKKGI